MTRLLYGLPLLAVVGVSLALLTPAPSRADEPGGGELINAPARRAIDLGTEFLVRLQNPDGSWPSDAGKKVNEHYDVFEDGKDIPHVGVTALAVLSLLAGGHLPGRGRYGAAMERGIEFIMTQVDERSGFIAGQGTRMYSHALATLALAEVYGVSRQSRVRGKLQDAVEFTVKSQNKTGGWRYVPFTSDSDMSVTVCQVVALRAAHNVGIKVPRANIDRALAYVMQSAILEHGRPTGAFLYQPEEQRFNRDSFALCAAALTTLFQAGLYDDTSLRQRAAALGLEGRPIPSISTSVAYMDQQYRVVHRRLGGPNHYFYYYGNYYAAQAMYQIGGTRPDLWHAWYRRVRDDLVGMTRTVKDPRTGRTVVHWVSNVDRTHAYATASALLILQFPLDHLPIHQR